MSMVFCHGCGKEIHETARSCPQCGAVQNAQLNTFVPDQDDKSAFDWYIDAFRQYVVFTGRARRKAYWYFVLINLVVSILLSIIGALVSDGGVVEGLYSIAALVPSIAVGVRRLHDSNRSGWWLLLPIVNLIFLCLDSDPEANRFGPCPKKLAQ